MHGALLALDESFDSNAMGLALQIPTQNVQVTKRHVECPQFGKPQLRIWSLFFSVRFTRRDKWWNASSALYWHASPNVPRTDPSSLTNSTRPHIWLDSSTCSPFVFIFIKQRKDTSSPPSLISVLFHSGPVYIIIYVRLFHTASHVSFLPLSFKFPNQTIKKSQIRKCRAKMKSQLSS